jgi:hypothetical protein
MWLRDLWFAFLWVSLLDLALIARMGGQCEGNMLAYFVWQVSGMAGLVCSKLTLMAGVGVVTHWIASIRRPPEMPKGRKREIRPRHVAGGVLCFGIGATASACVNSAFALLEIYLRSQ